MELQHSSATGSFSAPSVTLATPSSGTALILALYATATTVTGVTDSEGQTWYELGAVSPTGTDELSLWLCEITALGTTPTVTAASGGFYYWDATLIERDDVAGLLQPNQIASDAGVSNTPTETVATALATGLGNVGLVASVSPYGGSQSSSAGFTLTDDVDTRLLTAYQIATVDAAIFDGNVDWSSSSFFGQLSVALLPSTGGGGGGGLTGTGTVSVSSPVAVEVACVGIPAHGGTGLGNPVRHFNVGSISFSDDGVRFTRNHYIEHADELVPCPFAGVTVVAYSFAPGVSATITPLASY